MQTSIIRNGRQEGPYSPEQIIEALKQGNLTLQTPAWRPGMAEWMTLAVFPEFRAAVSAQPAPVQAVQPAPALRPAIPAAQMAAAARPSINVHRNGKQEGPYTPEQIFQYLKQGVFKLSDPAWRPGAAGWSPLSTFPEFQSLAAAGIPANPSAQPAAGPRARVSSLAVTSLVLGILSLQCGGLICAIPAVICGHLGRTRMRSDPMLAGGGMALAGLIMGYVSIALMAILLLWIFLGPGTPSLDVMKQLKR